MNIFCDHIASNRCTCVFEKGVIPCGISDHDIVYLIRNMRVLRIKKEPKTISVTKCKLLEKAFLFELKKLHFGNITRLSTLTTVIVQQRSDFAWRYFCTFLDK